MALFEFLVPKVLGAGLGAFQADSANKQNDKAYKEQKKAAEEYADTVNEYNQEAQDVRIANYEINSQYNWETALQKYDYTVKMRDYQERQAMRAYEADQARIVGQKSANAFAAAMGVESEQRALEQVRVGNAFEQQSAMVQQLRAAGKAALGQAGKSTQRNITSTIAELGRDIGIRDATLNSAITDANMNLINIKADHFYANKNLDLTAMLLPEEMPDIPEPIKPPDPIWMDPMEVDPMYIQPPAQQSVFAPLVQGAFDIASTTINYGIKNNWFGGD